MNFTTLSAILKGYWLLDPQAAKSLLPFLQELLSKKLSFDAETEKPKLEIYSAGSMTPSYRNDYFRSQEIPEKGQNVSKSVRKKRNFPEMSGKVRNF